MLNPALVPCTTPVQGSCSSAVPPLKLCCRFWQATVSPDHLQQQQHFSPVAVHAAAPPTAEKPLPKPRTARRHLLSRTPQRRRGPPTPRRPSPSNTARTWPLMIPSIS